MNLREPQIAASEAAASLRGTSVDSENEEESREEKAMEERVDRPDTRIVPWEEKSFAQRIEEVINERRQAAFDFGATFLAKSSPEMVEVANRAEESIQAQYPEMHVYHDVEGERRDFGVRFDPASWRYVSAPSDGAVVEFDHETGQLRPVEDFPVSMRPSHWSDA